jgi:hypothetical protein
MVAPESKIVEITTPGHMLMLMLNLACYFFTKQSKPLEGQILNTAISLFQWGLAFLAGGPGLR